jgi:hypothetical protein
VEGTHAPGMVPDPVPCPRERVERSVEQGAGAIGEVDYENDGARLSFPDGVDRVFH